mmetsp:Transcript_89920/g.142048  ORF Transcript_89920/g.142048 Transcript_89920/m.142048 type:complete len:270 (+) Transcript_89920:117-926(+)
MEEIGIASGKHFWHALEDLGKAFGASAIVDFVVTDTFCSEKAPPRDDPPGVSSRLSCWGPGVYRVTADRVRVSASLELGGASIDELSQGETIEVLDVVYRPYEHRLRGRIEKGWISLLDTEAGVWWVSKEDSSSNAACAKTRHEPRIECEDLINLDNDVLSDQKQPNTCLPCPLITPRLSEDAEALNGSRRDSIPRIPPPPPTPRQPPKDLISFSPVECPKSHEPLLDLDFEPLHRFENPARKPREVEKKLEPWVVDLDSAAFDPCVSI